MNQINAFFVSAKIFIIFSTKPILKQPEEVGFWITLYAKALAKTKKPSSLCKGEVIYLFSSK